MRRGDGVQCDSYAAIFGHDSPKHLTALNSYAFALAPSDPDRAERLFLQVIATHEAKGSSGSNDSAGGGGERC